LVIELPDGSLAAVKTMFKGPHSRLFYFPHENSIGFVGDILHPESYGFTTKYNRRLIRFTRKDIRPA